MKTITMRAFPRSFKPRSLGAQFQAGRRTIPVLQSRWNSAQSQAKPVSPHVGFYKTFARPIAKVLLMATFTYQLAYWAWVKLEKDEIKAQRTEEIEGLERQLKDLTREKTP